MKKRKKLTKKAKPTRKTARAAILKAPILSVGISEASAKALTAAVTTIIKHGKDCPSLALQAVEAVARAAKVESVSISNCTFATADGFR